MVVNSHAFRIPHRCFCHSFVPLLFTAAPMSYSGYPVQSIASFACSPAHTVQAYFRSILKICTEIGALRPRSASARRSSLIQTWSKLTFSTLCVPPGNVQRVCRRITTKYFLGSIHFTHVHCLRDLPNWTSSYEDVGRVSL